MRIFRQLGTWGTTVVLAPILWCVACLSARALAQSAYEHQITPKTRNFRVPQSPLQLSGSSVKDRLALIELQKYVRIWSLEPGASSDFPDAEHIPWSWNPLHGSALMLRLKQKQAFLLSQHHEVSKDARAPQTLLYAIHPDPLAALGGRRFIVEAQGDEILKAVEIMDSPEQK